MAKMGSPLVWDAVLEAGSVGDRLSFFPPSVWDFCMGPAASSDLCEAGAVYIDEYVYNLT